MTEKVHRIHSLPGDAPWQGGLPPAGSEDHPFTIRALDRVLAIQRPVVIAHLRSIRLRHPDASPAEIVRILERRYLAAVTTGGAAVGATAVVPGIGTGVTLALSGVETVAFLEATALFAQSVAEVHGIPVADPDRGRALVLTLMLGKEGVDLVAQLAGQAAGRGPARSTYWGEVVTKTLPRAAVGPLVDRLKSAFIRQFAAKHCRSASAPPAAAPATTAWGDGCSSAPAAPSASRPLRCHPSWSRGRTRNVSSGSPDAASDGPVRPSWAA